MASLAKDPFEWFHQAEYDLDTARDMLKSNRTFYAVFMSHLSLEKALKGLYLKEVKKIPPRIHNLIRLLALINIQPPEKIYEFLSEINEAYIATRYPEDIRAIAKKYSESLAKEIIDNTVETLEWIKTKY